MKDKCPTADICKLKPFTGEALIDDLSYIQAAFNSDEMLNTLLESESHPECKVTSETLYRVQTKGFRSEWRTYIAKWTFKIADHVDFNREMVSVALSLLDRYLSKVAVAIREFRLVAICSFYISAKAMCKKFVPVEWLCRRSAIDNFTATEVIKKEWEILQLLNWRLHTPTPQCFIRVLLQYISIPSLNMASVMDSVMYMVELASCEKSLIFVPPSIVALIAISQCLQEGNLNISERSKRSVIRRLLNLINANAFSIQKHRDSMAGILALSKQQKIHNTKDLINGGSKPSSPSPTSVIETSFVFNDNPETDIKCKRKKSFNTDSSRDIKKASKRSH